jgi:hypothetical protein
VSDALGAPLTPTKSRPSVLIVFLRLVACLLLAAGLFRAAQILGVTPDGKTFSDLVPAWRAGAVTLALVDLFAAVGLWVGAAWGPVMWAVAVAVEVSMYTVFADLFGSHPLRVAAHALLFSGFLALTFLEWRRMRLD